MNVLPWNAWFSLVVLSLSLSSCYTLGEGWQLMSIYARAQPFEQALREGALTQDERRLIELSEKIKAYAFAKLGLKQNQNYTKFVKTPLPYLTNVVSAAKSDAFVQYKWDYPLVGALPYRGFFQRKDAEAEADRLKQEGWDVMIRPVDAFSTLGFFSDPLFSFMSDYSEAQLADLLIHEQTHATIFLDGQADFNENLAVFVGGAGALLYMEDAYGPNSPQVRELLDSRADYAAFRRSVRELSDRLEIVYRDPTLDRDAKIARKIETIERFQKQFAERYTTEFKTKNWEGFSKVRVNNAYLMTFQNYLSGLDDFAAFYRAQGSDLARTIAVLKTLSKTEKDPLGWMKAHANDAP